MLYGEEIWSLNPETKKLEKRTGANEFSDRLIA
jgi:hypothetical protein